MQAELEALESNSTWKIVYLPHGVIPISINCVYRIERKVDVSIEKYKVRLVAKGYNKTEGVSYFETFSPMAKLTSILLILVLDSFHSKVATRMYMSTSIRYEQCLLT